jgi:hypothetical protein
LPAPASAQIANGSFETGFVDWSAIGGAAVTDSTFGVNPTVGFNQAFLTTDSTGMTGVGPNGTENIGPSVSASSIASGLNLSASTLNNIVPQTTAIDGSAISQSINVTAGQTLIFNYNFLTAEDPAASSYGAAYNNDFSFFTLNGNAYELADSYGTNSTGTITPNPNGIEPNAGDYLMQTGYQTYDFKFATAGTYTLGFGVVDGLSPNTDGGNDIASALLVDNVYLQNPVAAAPEAGTFAQTALLLIAGGALLSVMRGRKQPRKS